MSANTVPELPTSQPAQPGLPGPQNQSGFTIPPQGGQPAAQSHQYPGQKPGWVRNPGEQDQPKPDDQQAAPAAKADGLDIAAILQAALKDVNKPAEPAVPTESGKPDWMQGSINEFNVDTIDDPIIKSMASVLKVSGTGLDLDRVLGNALAHGDPKLIDYAHIAEKGGANAAQLAEIAKGIVMAVEAKSNAITKEIHDISGGEQQWSLAATAFNSSAPEELKLVVKSLLNSTDVGKIKAGAKIVNEFGRQSGQLPQRGSNPLNGVPAGTATGGAMSAAEFKAEIAKLDPNKIDYLQAREDLFRRRSLGKAAGL